MQSSSITPSYLLISEDSGACLTEGVKSEVNALYASVISSTAIVAKGDKGIALIHDSGRLSESSIKKVLEKIGQIRFWTLVCYSYPAKESGDNPRAYGKNGENNIVFKFQHAKVKKIMEEFLGSKTEEKYHRPPDNGAYFSTPTQSLFVGLDGNILYAKPDSFKAIEIPYLGLRERINALNQACLQNQAVDCDLLYTGKKFSPLPLAILPKDIEKLIQNNNRLKQTYERYRLESEAMFEKRLKEIKDKYGVDPLDQGSQALWKASQRGNLADILFLLTELKIDPNGYVDSGKTVLHCIVEHGNRLIGDSQQVLQSLNDSQIPASGAKLPEDIPNKKGDVPKELCQAIFSNSKEAQQFYINQAKQSKDMTDQCSAQLGKTFEKYKAKSQAIIDLLLQHQAEATSIDHDDKMPKDYDTHLLFNLDRPCQVPTLVVKESKDCLYTTQGSASIILFDKTPATMEGIYTAETQSDLAIIVKGKKGVVLVHDTDALLERSIRKILKRVGEIEFWAVAFHTEFEARFKNEFPQKYKEQFGEKGIFKTRFERTQLMMKKLLGEEAVQKYQKPQGKEYYETKGTVYVDRKGQIYEDLKLLSYDPQAVTPSSFKLRSSINLLNTSFNSELFCDLQYDGESFTDLPELAVSVSKLESEAKSNCVSILYAKYRENLKNYKIAIIQKKYNTDSLDYILRQVAAKGDVDNLAFLLTECKVKVDSQGEKSKKTALHNAIELGVKEVQSYSKVKEELSHLPSNKAFTASEEKNQKSKLVSIKKKYNVKDLASALIASISNQDQESIDYLLLEARSKSTIKKNYEQILEKEIIATKTRYQKTITLLIQNKASRLIKDSFEKIPSNYNVDGIFTID